MSLPLNESKKKKEKKKKQEKQVRVSSTDLLVRPYLRGVANMYRGPGLALHVKGGVSGCGGGRGGRGGAGGGGVAGGGCARRRTSKAALSCSHSSSVTAERR